MHMQKKKEALAFTWACNGFQTFGGLKFTTEADHKPLIPLLSTKYLEELPVPVQRFRLRML